MPAARSAPFRPDMRQGTPARAVPGAAQDGAAASDGTRVDLPVSLKPRDHDRLDPRLTTALLGALDWIGVVACAAVATAFGHGVSPAAVTLAQVAPALAVCLLLRTWTPHILRGQSTLIAAVALVLLSTPWIQTAPGLSASVALLGPCIALWVAARRTAGRILWGPAAQADARREKVVVIGATDAARRFIRRNADSRTVEIVAVFDDRGDRAPRDVEGVTVFGDVGALLAWPDLPEIDQVVVAVSPSAETRVKGLIERLRVAPNRVVLLLDLERFSPEPTRMDRVGDMAAAQVAGAKRDSRFVFAKRVQDLVLGTLLALAFAPIMAIVAIAVRLDSKGPILFKQARQGFNNRIITVWKFRTMRPQTSQDGPLVQVSAGDQRVTRIGAFLRRTSLDELPQLWNVLRGDMSLVGPRPHAPNMRTDDTEMGRIVAEYAHRCRVKPGLTGWAQINGSRGPLNDAEDVRERVRLDLEYIGRATLWLDLSILARTAPALLGDRLRVR